MLQKGQRFDRIYGLRHLAEDPWAAKKHPQLIGLTTVLLAGYIEGPYPHLVNSNSNDQVFAVLFIHTCVNSSHTFIVFLIFISWETDLQKSIDFLLNPFFIFRNDLYVYLLHYMYTCCYTKMK